MEKEQVMEEEQEQGKNVFADPQKSGKHEESLNRSRDSPVPKISLVSRVRKAINKKNREEKRQVPEKQKQDAQTVVVADLGENKEKEEPLGHVTDTPVPKIPHVMHWKEAIRKGTKVTLITVSLRPYTNVHLKFNSAAILRTVVAEILPKNSNILVSMKSR